MIKEMQIEGEWPEYFIKTVMVPIPKNSNAKKYDYWTISPHIACSEDTSEDTESRLKLKIKGELEKEQFGFRKRKGTRDAIKMIRGKARRKK